MMGLPLPIAGALSVRLDGDGNASTIAPGDLSAEADAARGSTTRLLLES